MFIQKLILIVFVQISMGFSSYRSVLNYTAFAIVNSDLTDESDLTDDSELHEDDSLMFSEMDSVETDTSLYEDDTLKTKTKTPDLMDTDVVFDSKDASLTKNKLIQRNYNHKQQIILGLGMMAFITIIFSTVQSWNP